MKNPVERWLEKVLFASRWLMAPFYVGLVVALAALAGFFFVELWEWLEHGLPTRAEDAILMALSLIDLSLTGNLVLIVILSGYENFVSRIDTVPPSERPSWMGRIDFSALKMKLVASIVAISAIALLRAFMELAEPHVEPDRAKLTWLVIVHLTFVTSGVLLAVMDWLVSRTAHHHEGVGEEEES